MPAPMHYSDGMSGWGSCGLPVSKNPHTKDGALVTCKRPGCRVHVPKVEQPRRIALVIAPATERRCGTRWHREALCPRLEPDGLNGAVICKQFGYVFDVTGGQIPERLPECIAAEVKP